MGEHVSAFDKLTDSVLTVSSILFYRVVSAKAMVILQETRLAIIW